MAPIREVTGVRMVESACRDPRRSSSLITSSTENVPSGDFEARAPGARYRSDCDFQGQRWQVRQPWTMRFQGRSQTVTVHRARARSVGAVPGLRVVAVQGSSPSKAPRTRRMFLPPPVGSNIGTGGLLRVGPGAAGVPACDPHHNGERKEFAGVWSRTGQMGGNCGSANGPAANLVA